MPSVFPPDLLDDVYIIYTHPRGAFPHTSEREGIGSRANIFFHILSCADDVYAVRSLSLSADGKMV